LKGGADDVKRHKWFKGIDWDELLERKVKGPISIKVKGEGDASNFEIYEEIAEESCGGPFSFYLQRFLM